MRFSTDRVGLVLALAVLATPLHAQQAPLSSPAPDSVQSMVQEFQTLRMHLGQVQDSALKTTPGLQEAQAAIQEMVEATMLEAQPSLEEDLERLESLRDEAAQAQAAQDQARLQQIMQEGAELRDELTEAQNAAMETEAVQARLESFQTEMMAAMAEIDADIEDAIARMEELAARLQAIQAQGG